MKGTKNVALIASILMINNLYHKYKRSLYLNNVKLSVSLLTLARLQVLTCVKCLEITHINLNQSRHPQIIPHTPIKPIFRLINPTCPHRILMNIIEFLAEEFMCVYNFCVIILLPKLIKTISAILSRCEFKTFQHPVTATFRVTCNSLNDLAGCMSFHVSQNIWQVSVFRAKDAMDMIGHHHIAPDLQSFFGSAIRKTIQHDISVNFS